MDTILVIDSHKETLKRTASLLKGSIPACRVITAQSACEGLRKARKELPDTIVLDIEMPRKSSFKVCRILKSIKGTRHIPLLMLAKKDVELNLRIRGLTLGADTFLVMPADGDELAAQVNALIRIKHAEDALCKEKEKLRELISLKTVQICKNERRYKELIELLPEIVLEVDEKGRITFANRMFFDALGYSNDDLMHGMEYNQLVTRHKDTGASEARTEEESGGCEGDGCIRRKDGGTVPVIIHSNAVTDEDGNRAGSRIVLTDISGLKRGEEDLREAHQDLNQIFNATAPLCVVDQNHLILRVNDTFCTLFGVKRGTVEGTRCNGVFDTAFCNPCDSRHCPLEKILSGAKRYDFEITQGISQGRKISLSVSAVPYCNIEGAVTGIVMSLLDMTDRKVAEKRIMAHHLIEEGISQASRLFFTAGEVDFTEILKALGGAIRVNRAYIFQLRDNGLKIDNTHEWCKEGTSPQIENLQDLDTDMCPWWMEKLRNNEDIVIPDLDDLPPEAGAEKEILKAQDIRSLIVVPINSMDKTLSGFMGFDDTEGCRTWSGEEIKALRVISEMIAIHLDRKRSQENLAATKREMEYLLKSSPAMIYSREASGDFPIRYISENISPQLGYGREEFMAVEDFWESHIHPADLRMAVETLGACIKKGQNAVKYRFLHKDMTYRWICDEMLVVKDPEGKPAEIIGSMIDVTEQKQVEDALRMSEEQLRHSQKMEAVGTLAGGIAHDFNNIITIVNGYSYQLIRNFDHESQVHKFAKEIYKSGTQAAALTQQLLAFSRKDVFQPMVMDLNLVVENMEKMLRRIIGEDIKLVKNLEYGNGYVEADPGHIEQVIMNLTINARDAMPEGGVLMISTGSEWVDDALCAIYPDARPGRYFCLSVSDTGIGMDEDIRTRIFEPFFTTKGLGKGTGLGLSVVYGIVKQHEGWINVESAPGKGATFKVYLPIIDEKTRHAEDTDPSIESETPQGNGERVLFVEDDEGIRTLVSRTLQECGYTVKAAGSAQEAMALFEQERGNFQLVLSDVVLPDINGLQMVNRILLKNPNIAVILCSGYTDEKSHYVEIQKRRYRFFQKPYDLNKLLKSIREAMATQIAARV